ncbi:hypothetical protein BCR34DRAFT_37384 [Clohesyomyces aquaticus]|uniref:FAD-binding FR-type domain-containing protein n=1 Tax=Clohesyomyces aquaticus TaxID=1231657 RepID=A0A1Y2A4G9_9PLEO|nr:hypothetical protein BCR34DRAFT_37384 [Clohesyomyces aquaticus]
MFKAPATFTARLCILRPSLRRTQCASMMVQNASTKANLSHEERTATEPRGDGLHVVRVDRVTAVNDNIRTFKLAIEDTRNGIDFLPGQWLDVHVPSIKKAGGFTVTSSPREAIPATSTEKPFLELAIQKSPDNPPAAWFWQPAETITGARLNVRIGGSFVWPPPGLVKESIKRVVFIAGGVGINPLMSMISYIGQQRDSLEQVRLLYATKLPSTNPERTEILFLPRILDFFCEPRTSSQDLKGHLELFVTGAHNKTSRSDKDVSGLLNLPPPEPEADATVKVYQGRIDESALSRAVGDPETQSSSVFYVCGPPHMTDSIVQHLRNKENVASEQVLCEKWW